MTIDEIAKTANDFKNVDSFKDENGLKATTVTEKDMKYTIVSVESKPGAENIIFGRTYTHINPPIKSYYRPVRVGGELHIARYTCQPDGTIAYAGIDKLILIR